MTKWKRKIKTKATKKISGLWGGCEQAIFFRLFRNWHFLEKVGKHYVCSEGNKARIFVDTIGFWRKKSLVSV